MFCYKTVWLRIIIFFFVNFFKFFLRISESFRKFATNLNLLNYVVY